MKFNILLYQPFSVWNMNATSLFQLKITVSRAANKTGNQYPPVIFLFHQPFAYLPKNTVDKLPLFKIITLEISTWRFYTRNIRNIAYFTNTFFSIFISCKGGFVKRKLLSTIANMVISCIINKWGLQKQIISCGHIYS